MEQAYAQALWVMVANGASPHETVKKLRDSLERSGRTDLWGKIAHAFRRLAEKKLSSSRMTLTIAKRADEHAMRNAAAMALSSFGLDEGNIETVIDESLVGGWRLEGREHLIDASHKKYLLELFNRATR